MAERRMFAKSVIKSAKFLRMPPTSRLLYYDLGMEADDDGIVEAYTVMKMTGASEDDLRVLIAKGFITVLNEDLVAYITDWNKNNKIRADRRVNSLYRDLLLQILPDVELIDAKERADRKKPADVGQLDNLGTSHGQPKDRIGKDRLGKDSTGKEEEKEVEEKEENAALSFFPSESCNEASESPDCNDSVFITMPVFGTDKNGNAKEAEITESFVSELEGLYQACDVRQSIRNAVGWCMAHPQNRKKDWKRFLIAWLQKDNDRARATPVNGYRSTHGPHDIDPTPFTGKERLDPL